MEQLSNLTTKQDENVHDWGEQGSAGSFRCAKATGCGLT